MILSTEITILKIQVTNKAISYMVKHMHVMETTCVACVTLWPGNAKHGGISDFVGSWSVNYWQGSDRITIQVGRN